MKKKILGSAVLCIIAFFAATRARGAPSPAVPIDVPALEAPVTVSLRDATEYARVGTLPVGEVTIYGVVAKHGAVRAETDAQHVARLISAPMHCSAYEEGYGGTGELAGTSGQPVIALCH
jgi:hypothetical protein